MGKAYRKDLKAKLRRWPLTGCFFTCAFLLILLVFPAENLAAASKLSKAESQARLLNREGYQAYLRKHWDVALQKFSQAQKLDPNYRIPIYNQACVLSLRGKETDLYNIYQSLLEVFILEMQAGETRHINKWQVDPDLAWFRSKGKSYVVLLQKVQQDYSTLKLRSQLQQRRVWNFEISSQPPLAGLNLPSGPSGSSFDNFDEANSQPSSSLPQLPNLGGGLQEDWQNFQDMQWSDPQSEQNLQGGSAAQTGPVDLGQQGSRSDLGLPEPSVAPADGFSSYGPEMQANPYWGRSPASGQQGSESRRGAGSSPSSPSQPQAQAGRPADVPAASSTQQLQGWNNGYQPEAVPAEQFQPAPPASQGGEGAADDLSGAKPQSESSEDLPGSIPHFYPRSFLRQVGVNRNDQPLEIPPGAGGNRPSQSVPPKAESREAGQGQTAKPSLGSEEQRPSLPSDFLAPSTIQDVFSEQSLAFSVYRQAFLATSSSQPENTVDFDQFRYRLKFRYNGRLYLLQGFVRLAGNILVLEGFAASPAELRGINFNWPAYRSIYLIYKSDEGRFEGINRMGEGLKLY